VGTNTDRDVGVLYVATPELVQHYGLDPSRIGPTTDVLTVRTGDLSFVNVSDRSARPPNVEPIDVPGYSSAPSSFITRDALRRHGWEQAPFGWLVESRRPFTSEQIAKARSLAADAGLTVEARREQRSLAVIGTGAPAAGIVLALGVLAMTVGLIRSEAARDLRTLTAAGATSIVRRVLTAATAGALALLGALLGTGGAYVALIAGYSGDLGPLSRVPVVDLLATAAGWLLAGREPPALARQALP
jgi:putative ABC transport system permease protein